MNVDENFLYQRLLTRLKQALGTSGTGGVGPKGDKGDVGPVGPQGLQGPAGTAAVKPLAIRVQTNAAGLYVWTFSAPFAAGVIPIVIPGVEDSTMGAMFDVKVTLVDNKSATIQVSKSVAVTVAGISVLGASVAAQAWIHATATAP